MYTLTSSVQTINFNSKDSKWGFLSNFEGTEIDFRGKNYKTVEAAFQASKFPPTHDGLWYREHIRLASSPANALFLGRQQPLILAAQSDHELNELVRESLDRRVHILPNWDQNKLDVMRELLNQKFTRDNEFGMRLVSTGEAKLVENTPHNNDDNWLGRLLMEVREHLSARDKHMI